MASGLASPQEIIVHAGKVVVDEGVGMNQLHCGRSDVDGFQSRAHDFAGSECQ